MVETASKEVIRAYWNERSSSYSTHVREEICGPTYRAWKDYLARELATLPARPASSSQALSCAEDASQGGAAAAPNEGAPRILDIGCGPGFFEILLGEAGCTTQAVDASPAMLRQAEDNLASAGLAGTARFQEVDAAALPFPDDSFDMVVSRNLSWLMRDLEAAYAEWLRVLRPGGRLLLFDANWYRYLADEKANARRLRDQEKNRVEEWSEESCATNDQERRCEDIALKLPSTYLDRPAWDERILPEMGFSKVVVSLGDERALWTESEQAFYRSSPLFVIKADK